MQEKAKKYIQYEKMVDIRRAINDNHDKSEPE